MWVTLAVIDGRAEAVGVEVFSIDPTKLPKFATGLTPKEAARHWPAGWQSDNWLAEPQRQPAGIRSVDLRIPLSQVVAKFMDRRRRTATIMSDERFLAKQPEGDWTRRPKVQAAARRIIELTDGEPPRRKAGRPSLPVSHYQEVAAIYLAALRDYRDPIQAVMAEKFVSKSQAAKWVYRCRRPPLNLLDPTRRGRAAGIADEIEDSQPTRRTK